MRWEAACMRVTRRRPPREPAPPPCADQTPPSAAGGRAGRRVGAGARRRAAPRAVACGWRVGITSEMCARHVALPFRLQCGGSIRGCGGRRIYRNEAIDCAHCLPDPEDVDDIEPGRSKPALSATVRDILRSANHTVNSPIDVRIRDIIKCGLPSDTVLELAQYNPVKIEHIDLSSTGEIKVWL